MALTLSQQLENVQAAIAAIAGPVIVAAILGLFKLFRKRTEPPRQQKAIIQKGQTHTASFADAAAKHKMLYSRYHKSKFFTRYSFFPDQTKGTSPTNSNSGT